MRIYPHLQDTGGFFICLMKKTGDIPEDLNKQSQYQQQIQPQSEKSSEKESSSTQINNSNSETKKRQSEELVSRDKQEYNPKLCQKQQTKKEKKLPYGSIDLKEDPFIPLGDQSVPFLQELR
jgi:hypothetical protein